MPGSSSERFVVKQQQQQQQHGQDSGHRPVVCRHRMISHRRLQAPAGVYSACLSGPTTRERCVSCLVPLPTHQIPQAHASHKNITLFMKASCWMTSGSRTLVWTATSFLNNSSALIPVRLGPSRINPLTTPSAQIVTRRFANIASIPPSISFPHRVERRTGLARVSSPIEQDAADWRQGGG
ncbi:hypothetical protein E4U19_003884 [Claviceps sp. Clav32 group G5]|nr:hypothetical protein E4U19_003884 [Claviceps sp. Clav32 group G5]